MLFLSEMTGRLVTSGQPGASFLGKFLFMNGICLGDTVLALVCFFLSQL